MITPKTPSQPVSSVATHWLVQAASRAGLAGAGSMVVPRSATITDAWDAVARALGLSTRDLAERLAPALRTAVTDLTSVNTRTRRLVPEKLARKFHVFPIAEDDTTITVATANPTDLDAEQALGFASGRRPAFRLATPAAISDAINAAYAPDRSVERLLGSVDEEIADSVRVIEESVPDDVAAEEVQAAPVVKLTNFILREAIVADASDVHIEPGAAGGVVRFRIDGVLRVQMQLPGAALNRVVSRIKVLSKLDISDRMRPQDGRARVEIEGRAYDLRVSTVPTREAEKAVIRVLRPNATRRLDDCELSGTDVTRLRQLLANRDGIVIVSGPTGSGKTTTLYSAVREVTSTDINVMTVEDPIEYELPGITQLQVEPKRGVTFPTALRAILRQDPDVILVGEIRDRETAEVAAQAALTGHLVLATLHTNDAMSAVSRLADLGLDRATIAAALRGSVAQRLVRRVCPECAQPVGDALSEQELRLSQAYAVQPKVRAVGCPACSNTGYRGRIPVNEIAVVTPAIAEAIAGSATAAQLQRAALGAGMRLLRDAAVERVREGSTTLQEIERVLGDASSETGERTEPQVSAPRVLVVDDDLVIRRLAATVLEGSGLTVDVADDGADALDRVRDGYTCDLVVTDLHMPHVGGEELLAKLRSNPSTATLPVLVLTGSAEDGAEITLMEAGADDYIRKPIDPPRFAARVKAALRRAAA